MFASTRVLCLIGLGAILSPQVHAQQPSVELDIVEMDPSEGAEIERDQPFSVRIRYKSEIPIRLRLEARLQGEAITESRLNVAPTYPAGEGEAIAWNVYQMPGQIDEIVVSALDQQWRPIVAVSRPVNMWVGLGAADRLPAAWVERLNADQQALAQEYMDARAEMGSFGRFLMPLLLAGAIAYLFLQPWTIKRFGGRWRLAAIVPLIATVPMLLYTAVTFAIGADLWPVLVLLLLPLATLYLLALTGAHVFAQAK